jgi:hypothetical protein
MCKVLCMKHGSRCPDDRESRAALERLWNEVLVWPTPHHHDVLHTPLGRRVREILIAREGIADSSQGDR